MGYNRCKFYTELHFNNIQSLRVITDVSFTQGLHNIQSLRVITDVCFTQSLRVITDVSFTQNEPQRNKTSLRGF